jgi:hypothetical protein
MFIHHPDDQPAHRTFLVANRIPRRLTVRRNHHLLMHARAMRINRHLRRALILAIRANRLADHESPAIEARMFPSRYDIAFDASE